VFGREMESCEFIIGGLVNPLLHIKTITILPYILKQYLKAIGIILISRICQHCKLSYILHFHYLEDLIATLQMPQQALIIFIGNEAKNVFGRATFNILAWSVVVYMGIVVGEMRNVHL
jgi:hypothetical protein